MYRGVILILFLQTFSINSTIGQDYKVVTIGFYNFESLFDTINTPGVKDTEFTPQGNKNWDSKKYRKKISNLAYVISKIGTDFNTEGAGILGVAEIENKQVLEDVINHKNLKDRDFGIVHEDSKDRRGIDVALIYKKKIFAVESHKMFKLELEDITEDYTTRDIMLVTGMLDSEKIHILVNHWPSRIGGKSTTEKRRITGAKICKEIVDSIRHADGEAKVLIVGDFNDNPNNKSISVFLKGKSQKSRVKNDETYNPMMEMFRKGQGTNAYRDTWSTFDQILVTPELVHNKEGFHFHEAYIFKKKFMKVLSGRFKDYPKRSFIGDEFKGGYSDHFPVYVHLLKATDQN